MEHWAGFEPAVFGICNPMHWASLPPVRCFYLHIIHNLVLCVKWWRARDSNPVYRKVEDLQSPEVTNASRSPYLATRDGIEPPLEVLETSALPLY